MGSKKPLNAPGKDPGPTVRDTSNRKRTHAEDLVRFHTCSPAVRLESLRFQEIGSTVLVDFSCHDLDLLCSCTSSSLSSPGLPKLGWLWIFTSASIIYWIKVLRWQLAHPPIWLQQKASSSTLSTIARSLSICTHSEVDNGSKASITRLQSTAPEKLLIRRTLKKVSSKENPKRKAWISLGSGNRTNLLG